MKLDQTDIKILKILQDKARIPNTELAKKLKMSPPPTLERVKKLEKAGVIKKYVALLEPASIGIGTFTFVEVTLSKHGKKAIDEFVTEMLKIEEIMECHHLTGDADYILKIAAKDISAYEDLLINKITTLPNVQHIKTMVILSTIKNGTYLPLA